MSWYTICFDRNWIRCTNTDCKQEYYVGIKDERRYKRKNKCPSCKLDNYKCIKKKKGKING